MVSLWMNKQFWDEFIQQLHLRCHQTAFSSWLQPSQSNRNAPAHRQANRVNAQTQETAAAHPAYNTWQQTHTGTDTCIMIMTSMSSSEGMRKQASSKNTTNIKEYCSDSPKTRRLNPTWQPINATYCQWLIIKINIKPAPYLCIRALNKWDAGLI